METVLDCVIPYIHDGNDRNSISLVSRKFYELDCITRKHVTVHLHYAPSPFRLNQRFPFLESLTLKGFPGYKFECDHRADVTPWIQEIAVVFKCLKALHIRCLVVLDSDIELLAKTRGNDLRSLKIYKSRGIITEDGLMYISMYCDKLTTLCLHFPLYGYDGGKWLHELALRNTGIETFSVKFFKTSSYYKDIAPVIKKLSKSLLSLRLENFYLEDIGDAFSHPVNYEDLVIGIEDIVKFKFLPTIRGLGILKFFKPVVPFVLPLFNQLRQLELTYINLQNPFDCSLLQRCPNLEVLCAKYIDNLQLVSHFFKKLRKLTFYSGTLVGLIAVAQGCTSIEYLHFKLIDTISKEALECIGSNLKNLRDFDMKVGEIEDNTRRDLLLDNGIQAMLIGCTKLERLGIHLYATAYLTDVGLGFIGKYGLNLRFLSLSHIGESDEGLLELSKGCPKLRKLRMMDCPFSKQAATGFVFNINSLSDVDEHDRFTVALPLITKEAITFIRASIEEE